MVVLLIWISEDSLYEMEVSETVSTPYESL
jgi:hypothetical protein